MDSFRYSDHPVGAYMIDLGVHQCEVAVLASLGDDDTFWNFFWLSNPKLDHIPGSGKDWWRKYTPVNHLVEAVIRDVSDDYTLHHALASHPLAFAEWWADQNHKDFHTYPVAGGDDWVSTVARRAEAAGDRLTRQYPPVVRTGNVLVLADYRRRA